MKTLNKKAPKRKREVDRSPFIPGEKEMIDRVVKKIEARDVASRREIIFQVEEDTVDGGFVATALGHSITTQADSMDELKRMIMDALRCHFEAEADIPKIIRLHFVKEEVMAFA